jgi:hypothetical protein
VRNSPSFQKSINHGHYAIELHAWRRPEGTSFAAFIYEKAAERLLRHFTGSRLSIDQYKRARAGDERLTPPARPG